MAVQGERESTYTNHRTETCSSLPLPTSRSPERKRQRNTATCYFYHVAPKCVLHPKRVKLHGEPRAARLWKRHTASVRDAETNVPREPQENMSYLLEKVFGQKKAKAEKGDGGGSQKIL